MRGDNQLGRSADSLILMAACGRLCLHRKGSTSQLACQKLGIKKVDDGIWLVSFMHYDLGYFDLKQKPLQPLDNPFGTTLSPMLGYDLLPMSSGWTSRNPPLMAAVPESHGKCLCVAKVFSNSRLSAIHTGRAEPSLLRNC
jgi:hypothetical protein